jgi:hypothetical protein
MANAVSSSSAEDAAVSRPVPNPFEDMLTRSPFSTQIKLMPDASAILTATFLKAVQSILIGFAGGVLWQKKSMPRAQQHATLSSVFTSNAPKLLSAFRAHLPAELDAQVILQTHLGKAAARKSKTPKKASSKSAKGAKRTLSGATLLSRYQALKKAHNSWFVGFVKRYVTVRTVISQ